MEELAIKIENLSKIYKLYDNPTDRLKEALNIKGKKYFKEFRALSDVSFEVKKGETVGIIGKNGAGKSTLLKIITGVLTPSSGKTEVKGRISALLELGAGFNQEYSGLENIYLNGRMMGYSKKEMDGKVQSIIDFADIGDFIYQPVKTYSSGMFARLAFAVSINVEPDILIVDEALSVGDLFFQNKCFRKFDELKEKGVTILFVSHDIASVRQMCSRVLWMEKGTQKIFDESTLVCDMYMDAKRQEMNENMSQKQAADEEVIVPVEMKEGMYYYPKLDNSDERFKSDILQVASFFVENEDGKKVKTMEVDHKYTAHVVLQFYKSVDNIIVGFIFENNKGLPLYDINNYINQQQTISGKAGYTIDVTFEYTLPRIMKGSYAVSVGISQGTQKESAVLAWPHGIEEIIVDNPGYNSSYIEIPSTIEVLEMKNENVELY